jgi:hypothetical protein
MIPFEASRKNDNSPNATSSALKILKQNFFENHKLCALKTLMTNKNKKT